MDYKTPQQKPDIDGLVTVIIMVIVGLLIVFTFAFTQS